MRGDLLHQLETHLEHDLVSDARRLGRTEATARVLLALDPGQGVPMAEVARRVGRDPSTATRFIDRAEREGLVTREAGADRRRRLVFLTAEGREAQRRLMALRDARAAALPEAIRAATGLGAEEVEWFLRALVEALSRTPSPSALPPPPEPPTFQPTMP